VQNNALETILSKLSKHANNQGAGRYGLHPFFYDKIKTAIRRGHATLYQQLKKYRSEYETFGKVSYSGSKSGYSESNSDYSERNSDYSERKNFY